jgi:hypothetical protein
MSHISSYETVKSVQKGRNAGKSYQELYDRYIKKGDEAIVAEDIVSAEKHYQYADHYLRLMNEPNFSENSPPIRVPASSRSMEELIAKALKGIKAERAARKEALLKQVREVAKASKAAREKKKDAACQEQAFESKMAGSKKKAGKKARNNDEPCKVIPFHSKAPRVELEKKN